MLKDKIVALLNEVDRDVLGEFFNCEVQTKEWDWDEEKVKTFRKVLTDEGITFDQADRYGGEDQGSDYWSVYWFTNGMELVFIKFDGWYASYEGSTYDSFYEVQAVEKTIIVFEKK